MMKNFINFWPFVKTWVSKNLARKKLLKREEVFKNNTWLKNRLLFGANLRADCMTVYTLKLAHNPYQAAKILACSMNSSLEKQEAEGWKKKYSTAFERFREGLSSKRVKLATEILIVLNDLIIKLILIP